MNKKVTKLEDFDEKYHPQEHSFEDMVADCFKFNEIALGRRAKRIANGSLTLENAQYYFSLDQESKMPNSFSEQL